MARKRVLAAASSGGHWIQLCRLSDAFADTDVRYLTTGKNVAAPTGLPAITVPEISRSTAYMLPFVWMKIAWVILCFRPDVVVTTGAAPGLIALQIAKLAGCTTIWIDSIANAEEVSLSGRLARKYSDLWLTQWSKLTASDTKLRYFGQVF
jgi:UDP-N-acetylglucosamine:LPS N-acetylglucosamine transferase